MSFPSGIEDRFWITKAIGRGVWVIVPPRGFGDDKTQTRPTFTEAVAAFVEMSEAQCPTCRRGEVVSTSWGWECAACGSSDVAMGCTRP